MERESGFYFVRYSGEQHSRILQYVHGNGWQRLLATPDQFIQEVGERILIV